MLRAEVVKHFADDADAFVFFDARFHETVKLVIGGIDHHGRGIEQRDLVLGFDFSHLVHQLLAVDDFDALSLQSEEHRHLDHVDADGLVEQFALFEFETDFFRHIFSQTGSRIGGAAQCGNTGAGTLAEPRAIDLMMARRRAEVPQDRLIVLR